MKRTLCTAILWVASMSGLMVGCDAEVQNTVMEGLQSGSTSIASALISAGFQTLMEDKTGVSSSL